MSDHSEDFKTANRQGREGEQGEPMTPHSRSAMGGVKDPTENVREMLDAAIHRTDDLRNMALAHVNQMLAFERDRVNELMNLRADHNSQLRDAEAKRIDAIRVVDVNAVSVANERAVAQACVSADTPILCADLIWRPAGDLQVGDELIALDEEIETRRGSIASRGRQYRRAVVTANAPRQDTLYLVTTSKGSVRCNREHPWLVKRPSSKYVQWVWLNTEHLRPGDMVMHAVDVWAVDRSYEAGWLAGIIDGEGYLGESDGAARLIVAQAEGEVCDLIAEAMSTRIPATIVYQKKVLPRRKPQKMFQVSAKADIMKLLGTVRPARLMAKADIVWMDRYIGGTGRFAIVESVVDAGVGVIASLTTDTHTYIAGGFCMHNTVLANQVAASAEALRALVGVTASTIAQQLQQLTTQLTDRLALLEKAQYEGAGRGRLADPMMADMMVKINALTEARATSGGQGAGRQDMWAWLLGGVMALVTIASVAFAIFGGRQ